MSGVISADELGHTALVMDGALRFTLGAIYLLVGFKQGERWEHLLFSCGVAAGANVYGPTRKLGRGPLEFFLAPAEVFVTVTTVNTHAGNAAAAG